MKYIITGGAGFIGSHLARKLIGLGHEVLVIDNFSTGRLENIQDLFTCSKFHLLTEDLLSIKDWRGIIGPGNTILHLAATVGVNKVCVDPLITLNNNFLPTISLLEFAAEKNCRFFFSSTAEVYGEMNKKSFSETDSLHIPGTHCGRSAYTLSKILSEQYSLNYARLYNLPVVVARLFNTIGPGQRSRYGMVVPTFISQALRNEPITLFGDGMQSRCFCDVSDVLNAILLLLDNDDASGGIYNICGTKRVTIKDLALYVKRITNSSSPIISLPFPPQRADGRDVHSRCGNITKIKDHVNWEPRISWTESIKTILTEESKCVHTKLEIL
ncbi:MAG TPA: NAD-dependent epimerase/dehydratase family protein [Flavisolibacter sp.]|jgi:UDP-glucose 4-epimerase|nr:NAD-dependent epimerase/dehydratase family protein [Flavisolibacter sp.]